MKYNPNSTTASPNLIMHPKRSNPCDNYIHPLKIDKTFLNFIPCAFDSLYSNKTIAILIWDNYLLRIPYHRDRT